LALGPSALLLGFDLRFLSLSFFAWLRRTNFDIRLHEQARGVLSWANRAPCFFVSESARLQRRLTRAGEAD
jgi:hypothetical protein